MKIKNASLSEPKRMAHELAIYKSNSCPRLVIFSSRYREVRALGA